mgnify:CR=1 FL=1
MISVSFRSELDDRKLQKLIDTVHPELKKIVRRNLFRVEAEAKKRSPVDTGRNRAAIHTELDTMGIGGQVNTGTDYAHFLELGTRNMPARPYMVPALLSVKPRFHDEIEELFTSVD